MMAGRKGGRFKAALPKVSFMQRKPEEQVKPKETLQLTIKNEPDEVEQVLPLEDAPRQMTLDYLLGSMPKPEQRIKEGSVQKLGMDGVFHDRYIVLTAQAVFLARSKDAESIKDCIPLCEIATIRVPDPSAPGSDVQLADEEPISTFEIQTRLEGDCSGVICMLIKLSIFVSEILLQ